MIPSRGLRWSGQAIGIGRRRIEGASSRQFSSSTVQHAPIRGSPLLSQIGFSPARITSKFQISRTNLLIRNGAAVRFASNAPLPSTTSAASTTTPPDAASASAASTPEFASSSELSSSLDGVTEFSSEPLAQVPHYIGYLKHLGFDYGWGPTSSMQWILEHVHVYAGTPWWATIIITGVVIRIAMIKLYVNASENATRMAIAAPLTRPLTEKLSEARAKGDQSGMLQIQSEVMRINKKAGVSMMKSFLPFAGGLTTYGMFVLLRAMARMPLPSLETGGALWFPNLCIPDPYLLLPIATAGILHWVLRKGGETGTSTLKPTTQKILMWVFPGLSLAFTFWLPAAAQLTFLVTGIASFLQAVAFKQPWFRNFWGMTPLPKKNSPTGYQGAMKRAASPVLSQAELNSRFQSTSTSFPRPPEDASSKLGKIMDTAMKPLAPIKDAMKPTIASARAQMEKRQDKANAKNAKSYEEKRQKELWAQTKERRERERAQREQWEQRSNKARKDRKSS